LVSGSGLRISLTALNMHDAIFEGLLAVQFRQHRAGAVELLYQPGPSFDRKRETGIYDGVMAKLGDDFVLKLQAVEAVEKTAAGKHKWLISTMDRAHEI
jgi:phenylacetate-CoA ligase